MNTELYNFCKNRLSARGGGKEGGTRWLQNSVQLLPTTFFARGGWGGGGGGGGGRGDDYRIMCNSVRPPRKRGGGGGGEYRTLYNSVGPLRKLCSLHVEDEHIVRAKPLLKRFVPPQGRPGNMIHNYVHVSRNYFLYPDNLFSEFGFPED